MVTVGVYDTVTRHQSRLHIKSPQALTLWALEPYNSVFQRFGAQAVAAPAGGSGLADVHHGEHEDMLFEDSQQSQHNIVARLKDRSAGQPSERCVCSRISL